MATTSYGVNDALAVKLWSKRLDAEVLKETYFARFMGSSSNSLAQIMTETEKGAGDRVRFGLRKLFTGRGRGEGQVLEGNEESLTTYYDEVVLGDLRHGAKAKSDITIDAQRIPYDLREINYEQLKDWFSDRLDTCFFNQLCGNTAQTDVLYTGLQATIAPSSNRVIRAGAQANDQSLTSSDTFSLNLLDKAVTRAKTATPGLRPLRIGGEDMYVCFIHPDQAYSLYADTSTAGNWFDLQKARLQGGEKDGNGIFTGAIGRYKNVIIHESTRIPLGVNSSTGAAVSSTRRAVLCGAQSLAVVFGQKYGKNKFQWVEKTFDYDDTLGVSARCIFGMKKTVYNSEDYGTIVLPTYAAAQ